jgi:DnaJ-domain-containing protein 1
MSADPGGFRSNSPPNGVTLPTGRLPADFTFPGPAFARIFRVMTQTATSPGSFREMFRAAEDRQDLCLIAILAWIASCDGTIAPQERELLDGIAAGLPHLPNVGAVIDAMATARVDDLELACRHVRNRMDRGGKRLLLQLAVTMAVQDGYLTVGENWVLQFLADLLGMSPRKFARLFQDTTHRPFPTAGDPSSLRWWHDREAGIPAQPSPEAQSISGAERGGAEPREPAERMTRAVALRVLGLDESAPPDAVHRAYRRMAKFRHPDRFAKLGPAAVSAATAAFERVKDAYQLLSSDAAPAPPVATP